MTARSIPAFQGRLVTLPGDLALPPALRDWLSAALAACLDHPRARPAWCNPALRPPLHYPVELLVLSRQVATGLGVGEDALGAHLADPDLDLPAAQAHRIALVWAPDEIAALLDPLDPGPDLFAWAITLPHEIMHLKLFAEHGGGRLPTELAEMEGDIGHALFDISTGYGIRPLEVSGTPRWSDSAEEALADMEDHVEEAAETIALQVFQGDLDPGHLRAFLP